MYRIEGRNSDSSLAIAFEGPGGSGKSTLIKELLDSLPNSGVYKIGGMGELEQVMRLKPLMGSIWERYVKGELTEGQPRFEVQKAQRIPRFAMRQQVAHFLEDAKTANSSIFLLDRLPLITLAFMQGDQEDNKYIEEVRDEIYAYTRAINLDKVFYLQLSPEETIARTISRYLALLGESERDTQLPQMLSAITEDSSIKEKIQQRITSLLYNAEPVRGKVIVPWDLMPYETFKAEDLAYQKLLTHFCTEYGIDLHFVNAERPIEDIKNEIEKNINSMLEQRREDIENVMEVK